MSKGTIVELTAHDGHRLSAYRAVPDGQPRGGLVMIQEIFGLTDQMKRCADAYAEAGYLTILPSLFDRIGQGVVLGYDEFQKGGKMAMSIDIPSQLADVEAARSAVADAGNSAIIGYCFGGTVAYLSACALNFSCAACYYGGGIGRLAERMKPKIPVIYHFGSEDAFISPAVIDQIREADPGGEFHVYEGAGHGFNCDDRDGYHPEAARLSTRRTLSFFEKRCQTPNV